MQPGVKRHVVSIRRILAGLLVALLLCGILYLIPTQYVLVLPGKAEEVFPLLEVRHKTYPSSGKFFLTTVYSADAPLLLYLYGLFDSRADLIVRDRFLSMNASEKEMWDRQMIESQLIAKAVALTRLGYQVEVRGKGVQVHGLLPGSRAENLQEGDLILSVEGSPTRFPEEIVRVLDRLKPGQVVTVRVLRGGKEHLLSVPTVVALPERKARLGIRVTAYGLEAHYPFEISVHAGKIQGSSAGLMFALALYDLLIPEDLTGGMKIAGTGTLSLSGRVGAVQGVRQKIMAALNTGAQYFLVPTSHLEEARRSLQALQKQRRSPGGGMVMLPAGTFDQAVEELRRISKGGKVARRENTRGLFINY